MEATKDSGIRVSVGTAEGELVDADAYAFGNANGHTVRVEKESRQAAMDPRVMRWAEPRVESADLLYFLDANVWHRRCVQVKAMLVGGLGWQLLQDGEVVYDATSGERWKERKRESGREGKRERVVEGMGHPAVRLLVRPNGSAMQPLHVILQRFLIDYYSLGNAYLEVVRDRAGRIAELYHVPGRTMRRHARFQGYFQVKGTESVPFRNFGEPVGLQSDASGATARSEILHLYQYDPQDDYYGMPDWYAALGAMGLDRTILEFNTYLFSNALMAHTAIVVEGGRLSDGAREAVKSFLHARATGANNAGRVLLLEDERDSVKVRFEKLGLDVEDVMIVEAQKHFRDVVVAAHGVPPRILGIITPGQLGATGEVEGQLRTFVETVLRPGQRELETALGVLLEEVAPGCRIRFSEMDVTDLRADGEFYAKMIERGVFTAEEVRGMVERRD